MLSKGRWNDQETLDLDLTVVCSSVTLRGMTDRPSRDVQRVPVPPPRNPARADLEGQFAPLRGRRVVVSNADGVHTGWVAWSDLETDKGGDPWVVVCPEREWWVWDILGWEPPTRVRWPAGAVWTD